MTSPKVIVIEPCNYEDYPVGGQLTFVKQLLNCYGERLALVGISTGNDPIGKWFKKEIDGSSYWFFSIARYSRRPIKPLIPHRVRTYFTLTRYKKRIMAMDIRSFFTQSPEALLVITNWNISDVCYLYPGVANPLTMPRYKWGKLLASIFEKKLFHAVSRAHVVLAAADGEEIRTLVQRSDGRISRNKIAAFPSRYDDRVFFPQNQATARKNLGLRKDAKIIVTVGRITGEKGWALLIDAFAIYVSKNPESLLVFVGDGEDRPLLEKKVVQLQLKDRVMITGYTVAENTAMYLNAADLFVMASFREGWSIAMLEALACAKPIVSTKVSGTSIMIRDSCNGFIVKQRDPTVFADTIEAAMSLKHYRKTSLDIAGSYAQSSLKDEFRKVWATAAC